MAYTLTFLSLCILLIAVTTGRPITSIGDTCSIHISRFNREGIAFEDVEKQCSEGTLYWSYPSGSLVLNFRPRGIYDFHVCFDIHPDVAVFRFYDVTDGTTTDTELAYPKRGTLSCVPSLNGQVSVEIEGPGFPETYMYVTNYRIFKKGNTPKKNVFLNRE